MPKPSYILCAESYSADETTKLLSVFKIVDRIIVGKVPDVAKASDVRFFAAHPAFHVIAIWRFAPEEYGNDYEYEMNLILPSTQDQPAVMKGGFQAKAPVHRFVADISLTGYPGVGMAVAENKVRRKGDSVWVSQSYEFAIEAAETN